MFQYAHRFERLMNQKAQRVARRLERAQRHHEAYAGGALRQARGAEARRRRVAVALFAGSLVAGLLLSGPLVRALAAWSQGRPVAVASLSVLGLSQLSSAEVARAAAIPPGASPEVLDLPALEARLVAHPWIRSARATVLPSGVVVAEVEERLARAVVRAPDTEAGHDRLHFVDARGVAFAHADPALAIGLPRLASPAPLRPGDEPDARLQEALALADEVSSRDLMPLASMIGGGAELALPASDDDLGWVLRVADGPEVVLGRGDVNERLDRLERLVAAAPPALLAASQVDLRFADQAVLRGEAPLPR